MAKKFAVRCADAAGHYGERTSQNNWILFDTTEARKAFLAEFSCSGRVWIDPANDQVDEIALLPEEARESSYQDKIKELEKKLAEVESAKKA
jgi:hypothetical protein